MMGWDGMKIGYGDGSGSPFLCKQLYIGLSILGELKQIYRDVYWHAGCTLNSTTYNVYHRCMSIPDDESTHIHECAMHTRYERIAEILASYKSSDMLKILDKLGIIRNICI